jgi:hypothetical protein
MWKLPVADVNTHFRHFQEGLKKTTKYLGEYSRYLPEN